MDKINFFPDELDVQNTKIILRLDLNVPLKDKVIKDYTRINLCLLFMGRVIFSHHSDQMFQINIKMRFRKKCFQSSSITKNA